MRVMIVSFDEPRLAGPAARRKCPLSMKSIRAASGRHRLGGLRRMVGDVHMDLTGQRAMDRAFARHGQQTGALRICESAEQLDRDFDSLHAPFAVLAMVAIRAMVAIMPEAHDHIVERDLLARGDHAQRHRGAGAKR